MAQEPQKSNPGIIIAVIGVIGTIIVTIITVVGNSRVEMLRRETELTRIALESVSTQSAETRSSSMTSTLPPTTLLAVTPDMTFATSPTSTHTLTTPTYTASPTEVLAVLFEDDFEDGEQKWTTNSEGTWVIRDDGGNHFYCVDSKIYAKAYPKNEPSWDNFFLEFDILINQFNADIYLRDYRGSFLNYELEENSVEFNREEGGWIASDKTFAVPRDQWTKIRINAIDSNINIFVNGNVFTSTLSHDQNLSFGSIKIGASPNAKVCFDNIKVSSAE